MNENLMTASQMPAKKVLERAHKNHTNKLIAITLLLNSIPWDNLNEEQEEALYDVFIRTFI